MKHARCAAAEGGFPFDHAMAAANTLVLRCEDDIAAVAAALLWHRFLDEDQFLALVTGTTLPPRQPRQGHGFGLRHRWHAPGLAYVNNPVSLSCTRRRLSSLSSRRSRRSRNVSRRSWRSIRSLSRSTETSCWNRYWQAGTRDATRPGRLRTPRCRSARQTIGRI